MASVTFDHVTKRFGQVTALRDVQLHIRDREFLVLVGPSGCGKTTALRLVAGLDTPTEGHILIGDQIVDDIPPKDRDIAMVFQSYALYPHMTVYDNMAFGLKLHKVPRAEIRRRVHEAAEMLGIENLLDRYPRQLSGGQRQRVAVGRAIVRQPKVFLFDEPLSNLDAKLRVQTRAELTKLHQRLRTTFIYVTHDQVEAMTMADRIAVMNLGELQQVDTPQNLYDAPANKFVAGFIGSPAMNFFTGRLEAAEGHLWVVTPAFRVQVPDTRRAAYTAYVGRSVILGVRPEHIHHPAFTPPGIFPQPVVGTVEVVEPMGAEQYVYLRAGEQTFVARVDPRARYRMGEQGQVVFDMSRMHLFDPETERAIR